jgi:hypothetical protein
MIAPKKCAVAEALAEEGLRRRCGVGDTTISLFKKSLSSVTQPHCILTSLEKTLNTFAPFGPQSKGVKAQTPDPRAGAWPWGAEMLEWWNPNERVWKNDFVHWKALRKGWERW